MGPKGRGRRGPRGEEKKEPYPEAVSWRVAGEERQEEDMGTASLGPRG